MEKVKRKTKSDTRQPTNGRKREQGLRLFPSPKRLVEKREKREQRQEIEEKGRREKGKKKKRGKFYLCLFVFF